MPKKREKTNKTIVKKKKKKKIHFLKRSLSNREPRKRTYLQSSKPGRNRSDLPSAARPQNFHTNVVEKEKKK